MRNSGVEDLNSTNNYLSFMCDFFFFCNVKIDMIIIPYAVLNKDDDDDDLS